MISGAGAIKNSTYPKNMNVMYAMYPKITANVIVVVPKNKLGTSSPTVSKLPPILEYFLQRLQTYYSNYIYEDLSRPPTYDRPIYITTQKPDGATTEPTINTTTEEEDEDDEEANTDTPNLIIYETTTESNDMPESQEVSSEDGQVVTIVQEQN